MTETLILCAFLRPQLRYDVAVPRIFLKPSGKILEAPKNVNLLEFLHSQGIAVGSACGGKGMCASCKVQVLEGAKNLSRANDVELAIIERNNLQKHERISCQSKVLGDVTITTSYW